LNGPTLKTGTAASGFFGSFATAAATSAADMYIPVEVWARDGLLREHGNSEQGGGRCRSKNLHRVSFRERHA
jgi:hypothetical protein